MRDTLQTMNRLQWAQTNIFVSGGKVCNTPAVELALVAWQTQENSRARWNPLDSEYRMPGDAPFNDAGVRNYATLESGLRAVYNTLHDGTSVYGYDAIIWDLADDKATATQIAQSVARSEWGTWRGDPAAAARSILEVQANWAYYSQLEIAT